MSAPDAGAVPAPGSDAARKIICTCIFIDDYYGWETFDCPVHDPRHDPLDDQTMRPRTVPARCGCGHLVSDHRGGVCQHTLCPCADMRPRTDAETGGRDAR